MVIMTEPASRKMGVLLVEDHLVTLDGISRWLSEGGEFDVVGKATTAEDAIMLAENLRPQLILLDLHLPGAPPIKDLLSALRGLTQGIVVLSADDREPLVRAVLTSGASAYLLKTEPYEIISLALRKVYFGARDLMSL